MNLIVIGVNHQTAPVEVREQFAIPEARLPEAVKCLASHPGIEEAMIVSTCNRVELVARADGRRRRSSRLPAEAVWLRSPALPQVSLRISRARCHPSRLPRDLEPGLDGRGRAADSGTGEGSLRHRARRRRCQFATRCAFLARLRGGQAGADRDRHRHVRRFHRFGRGGPGQEDLRQPRRQERLPGRRGQDVRTRCPSPAGAWREQDLRRQSHLRARRCAGQEVQRRSHPVRSALRHRRSRRHRHHAPPARRTPSSARNTARSS